MVYWRGAKKRGMFRRGIDPTELYIAIAALGYFYLSNSATLSQCSGVSYVRRPAWTNIGVQARR